MLKLGFWPHTHIITMLQFPICSICSSLESLSLQVNAYLNSIWCSLECYDMLFGRYNITIGHHNLEDQFHWVRWVPIIFLSCNITSELRSRVDRSMLIHVNFNF